MLGILREKVEDVIAEYLEESGAIPVRAEQLNLDGRCGNLLISIDEGWIASTGNTRRLEYYGGFEYINREDLYAMGEYTFYSDDSNRVRDALEYYKESVEQ